MTTSDDEPRYDDPAASADAPVLPDATESLAAATEPGARWPLAILAALGAMLVGVVVWALIYAYAEKEFVGVSVIIALAAGWLIRVISRRSNLAARIAAVLVTALGCVAGSVVGEVAYAAKNYKFEFWELLGKTVPNTVDLMTDRPGRTYAIFAAALVLAYLSAGPQKEKAPKRGEPTPVAVADDEDDDRLPTGD